jgi:hypothetical protein
MIRKHALGTILATVLGAVLMIYTASRTVHFIRSTLDAEQQVLAFIALAAFDGGAVIWLILFLRGASGRWQKALALSMFVLDVAALIGAFILDTLLTSGRSGLIAALSPDEVRAGILFLSLVIAANVVAVLVFHALDPEAMRLAAERDARDKIEEAALKAIATQADTLAAQLAPVQAAAWVAQMRARVLAGIETADGGGDGADARASDAPDSVKVTRKPTIQLAADARSDGGDVAVLNRPRLSDSEGERAQNSQSKSRAK